MSALRGGRPWSTDPPRGPAGPRFRRGGRRPHYQGKSSRPEQNALALAALLAPLEVLPFDDGAAAVYGTARAKLERAGTPIGSMYLLIAADARALGRTNRHRQHPGAQPGSRFEGVAPGDGPTGPHTQRFPLPNA